MSIENLIRKANQSLTQQQIAAMAEVSQSTIARYLSGNGSKSRNYMNVKTRIESALNNYLPSRIES